VHVGKSVSINPTTPADNETMTARTVAQIQTEIDAVVAQGRKINRLQNEGAEGNDHTDDDKIASLYAERQDVVYATDWTREATIERRDAWNASVRAAGPNPRLFKLEREAGFTAITLRKAINHHAI